MEVEFISFDGKSLAPAPEAGRWSRRFVTRRDRDAHWRERSQDHGGILLQMAPCKSGIGRRAERGTGPLIHDEVNEHEHASARLVFVEVSHFVLRTVARDGKVCIAAGAGARLDR